MGIASVTEYKTGRASVVGQLNRRLRRRQFTVVTTHPYVEQMAVELAVDPNTAVAIPRMYQPYLTATTSDPGCIVRSVQPTQRENSRITWDVSVEYDSEFERKDNPFSEPPEIRLDSEPFEKALVARHEVDFKVTETAEGESQHQPFQETADPRSDVDPNGFKRGDYCTSAGEPFDPPLMQPNSRPIVIFTRNEAQISVAFKVEYENSVNKKNWCGLYPRQAWLRSIKAQNHVMKSTTVGLKDIHYMRVEYVFALAAETWDLQVPDIGSYYLDYSSGSAVRRAFTVEGTGQPRLGRLDHSDPAQPGKKLAAGSDVQFLRFPDVFRTRDFAKLNINLNLSLEQRSVARRER